MRAVTFDPQHDSFSLKDITIPSPGPDEVRVRVLASSINPVDAKIIHWKRQVKDMTADWVPGVDVSGIIDAVGSAVRGWSPGDRVLYHGNMFRDHGGFAEYAIHRAATLIPHPDVPPETAAAVPCAGWTAYRALVDKLQVSTQDSLLVGGGSGSVGGFAVQIARALGVGTVIATCSPANAAYVQSLGASHTIDYHHEDIVGKVMEITGGTGATRALDTIGNGAEVPIADSLAFEGQIAEIVSLLRPELYEGAAAKGLSFHQLALGNAHGSPATEHLLVKAGLACSRLLEEGKLTVTRKRVITLEEAASLMGSFLKSRPQEKLIIVP